GESWPISTMPLRMARVRSKCSYSASPSPLRIALVSAEMSSLKRPSISSTASLLARNTSRHMVGSEAAGRKFQNLGPRHVLHFVGGADDGVGDQMRQMAGDGEHQIVVIGGHGL